jgi:hypothetical protein
MKYETNFELHELQIILHFSFFIFHLNCAKHNFWGEPLRAPHHRTVAPWCD